MTQVERSPFARALLDAAVESFADVPAEEALDTQFSPAFEKRIKRISKKTSGDTYRPVTTAMRRAILIAAIIAALAITVMAVPQIRKAAIQFFIRNAGTHYEFTYDPEQLATAPKQIEKVYKPGYIPEGFVVTDPPIISTGAVMYTWFSTRFSEIGDYISFDQYVIPRGENNSGPNAEGVETRLLNLRIRLRRFVPLDRQ